MSPLSCPYLIQSLFSPLHVWNEALTTSVILLKEPKEQFLSFSFYKSQSSLYINGYANVQSLLFNGLLYGFSSLGAQVQLPVDSRRAGIGTAVLCLAPGTPWKASKSSWAACIEMSSSVYCWCQCSIGTASLISRSTNRLTWNLSFAPITRTLPCWPCHEARNWILPKV